MLFIGVGSYGLIGLLCEIGVVVNDVCVCLVRCGICLCMVSSVVNIINIMILSMVR